MKDMTSKEAIEMMTRCKNEIIGLKAEIGRLRPKADAYDNISVILSLIPTQGISMSEDMVWTLDKRIRELQQGIVQAIDGKPLA